MLEGCVQPAMMPNINSATARVLDAADFQVVSVPRAGCCGAIRLHTGDHKGGLDDMRRNIDAWWPAISSGEVEAIVMNASGCGATVKDYADLLKHDAEYAEKAARVSELTRDLSELLPELLPRLRGKVKACDKPAGKDSQGVQKHMLSIAHWKAARQSCHGPKARQGNVKQGL